MESWKEPDHFITVPSSWTNTSATHDAVYTAGGYATYAVRLILPKNAPQLALYINTHLPTIKIFANGVALDEYGTTDKNSNAKDIGMPYFMLLQHEKRIFGLKAKELDI